MPLIITLLSFWWIVPIVAAVVFWQPLARLLFGILMVPENRIAVVTKKFRLFGKNISLPDGRIVALLGEAGVQARTLPPGLHLGYWIWQFKVDLVAFVTVPEGAVGVVEARDGNQIERGRVFASAVDCDSYQDAQSFLTGGGQRGPQLEIIRPGSYRINPQLFTVTLKKALQVPNNTVALITTNDGAPLPAGEIAAAGVDGHQSFQNGQAFIDAGGFKGRQEQVLLAGTYYVNPDFISTEFTDLTSVPIGHVGVVVAYMGREPPERVTPAVGEEKHANIVKKGEKGVLARALDPGKYPINTYIQKVELVPTTNIVLNWAVTKNEAHLLDKNLSSITVRSADGFSFNLDVSQIIHIAPDDASKVIARFGSMQNLVTQVLEPLIGNYFRNSAQDADILTFLRNRAEQQNKAKAAIEEALGGLAVQAVNTLIGDISPPAELMKTLTDRKVAEQQTVTYEQMRKAEEARQSLEENRARADTQASVVAATRQVEIAERNAESVVKSAEGEAKSKTINAEADAMVLITVGNAKATNTSAVGGAEAEVLEKKVAAVGRNAYSTMQITEFLSEGKMQLVPQVLVSGGGEKSGSIVDALLGLFVMNQLDATNDAGIAPAVINGGAPPLAKTSIRPATPRGAA